MRYITKNSTSSIKKRRIKKRFYSYAIILENKKAGYLISKTCISIIKIKRHWVLFLYFQLLQQVGGNFFPFYKIQCIFSQGCISSSWVDVFFIKAFVDFFNSASFFNTIGSDCTCVSVSVWKDEACIEISIRKSSLVLFYKVCKK